jgi:hypothetical protein
MTEWRRAEPEAVEAMAASLRKRVVAAATSIAWTEDWVADTFDRMALDRPREADRLHAKAARSRRHAAMERAWAAQYCAGRRTGAAGRDACGPVP